MGCRGTEEVDRDSEQRGRQEEADSEEAEKGAAKGAYSRDARANEEEDGQTEREGNLETDGQEGGGNTDDGSKSAGTS